MSLRQRLLSMLADPNVAYMLLMLGAAGLFFEISTPGVVLPGVIGGISLRAWSVCATIAAGELCRVWR